MSHPSEISTQRPPCLAGQSVVIAGAGIGGLAFAVALCQQWPSSPTIPKPRLTVFERDSYDERVGREGYTITLRTDGGSEGVQVLDQLDLYETARRASVQGGSGVNAESSGSMFIWDREWNEVLQLRSPPVGEKKLKSMRIRRNALQRVLADAAQEQGANVELSRGVIDAHRAEDGRMAVSLADGTKVYCDLLIAADGSSSKLRARLRPGDTLHFAGVVCISGTAKFEKAELLPKPLDRDWGLLLGGQGLGLFVAPVDRGSALWSFSYYAPQPRDQVRPPLSDETAQALLEEARSFGKQFPPRVNELVDATDPTTLMVFNAMDRPPFPHSLAQHGPVVWIGDANHAVSPFAGNGANMALIDAIELARCLVDASSLEGVLSAYDKGAIPRATATLKTSRWSIDLDHSTGVKLWLYTVLMKGIRFFSSCLKGNA